MDLASGNASDSADHVEDFNEARIYKRIDELLFRVEQLDEIMRNRGAVRPEKSEELREKMRQAQQELEQLYAALDE